jgi:hypothetical protein
MRFWYFRPKAAAHRRARHSCPNTRLRRAGKYGHVSPHGDICLRRQKRSLGTILKDRQVRRPLAVDSAGYLAGQALGEITELR